MIERIELAPGYSICRVINGLWQLSSGHRSGQIETANNLGALRRLVDAGFTTFDCADIYLGVEEILGALVREIRPSGRNGAGVEIHTKYVPDRSALATLRRSDVARGIEGSLRRLEVERLDLVQLHWWDYDLPNYLEVAGWLAELCDEGKVRHLGTTNFDLPRLQELVAAGIPIVSNQAQYSVLDRRVEQTMTAFCSENGIHLLCYGVLAGGFLSGRWVGQAEPKPPFENRSLIKYKLIIDEFGGWSLQQELLETLRQIATKHVTSITAVAARWILDRPVPNRPVPNHQAPDSPDPDRNGPYRNVVGAVMIGARSDAHIDDNREIFELRLDQDDRDRIESILARAEGPSGEPFELERQPDSRHTKIMWSDLNSQRDP